MKSFGLLLKLVLVFILLSGGGKNGVSAPIVKDVMKSVSQLPTNDPSKCLKKGSKAPNITLDLVGGGKWKLANEIKRGPVILVFYRGGWCPYCNLQLQTYARSHKKFRKYGVRFVGISVDAPDKSAIAKPTKNLPFPVASDSDLQAINLYNVAFKVPSELVSTYLKNYNIDLEGASGKKHHVIAMPAVVLIDREQNINWCYANKDYKIRPAVSILLSKLMNLSKKQ